MILKLTSVLFSKEEESTHLVMEIHGSETSEKSKENSNIIIFRSRLPYSNYYKTFRHTWGVKLPCESMIAVHIRVRRFLNTNTTEVLLLCSPHDMCSDGYFVGECNKIFSTWKSAKCIVKRLVSFCLTKLRRTPTKPFIMFLGKLNGKGDWLPRCYAQEECSAS